MTEDKSSQAAVVPLRMRPEVFLDRLRELAKDTRNIKWSRHARDRMSERDIPLRMALRVLQDGHVRDAITPGDQAGEWRAKIVREVSGRREVGVVAIIVKGKSVFVKTVEWEDMR